MNGPNEPVDPVRLAGDPEVGALLRRANLEYRAGLDEAEAFHRVGEQLAAEARRPRPRAQAVTAIGLACAAAAGWLVWIGAGHVTAPEVMLGPEVSVGESAKVPSRDVPPTLSEAESEPPPEPAREAQAPIAERASIEEPARERAPQAALSRDAVSRDAVSRDAVSRDRLDTLGLTDAEARPRRDGREREAVERRTSGARQRAQKSEAELVRQPLREQAARSVREDCLELARHGEPRAAERCFDQRAAGSGLGAEMALYEMARLRRDVLSDAVGALAALSAYRERFERGSLRNEVDLSRVELLAELGRSADALRESAALLAGASGRERAAELHFLRGDVYRRDVGDLRAAAAEYAQVEAFGGPRGAEASRRLGACLEALGDVPGALAAYRRYVRDPERPHVTDVREHIERLAGASARAGSSP